MHAVIVFVRFPSELQFQKAQDYYLHIESYNYCLQHVGIMICFAPTACNNGDILLYNGTTLSADFSSGTVLVCLDNVYGTVCDDFWDTLDASVVCSWLGFNPTGMNSSVIITYRSNYALGYNISISG